MENQRKFLEDHDIKIQEIENVVNKIMKDKRRQEEDQIETTGEKDHRMKLVPRALSSSGARGSFLLPSPREVSKHDFLRQRPATLSWLHFTTWPLRSVETNLLLLPPLPQIRLFGISRSQILGDTWPPPNQGLSFTRSVWIVGGNHRDEIAFIHAYRPPLLKELP